MKKKAIIWAAIFGFTAVIFGALAAHALKDVLTVEHLHAFETGVRFQIYHALLLLIIGFNANKFNLKYSNAIVNLLVIGIFCFSFSIYLLSIIPITGWHFLTFLGPVTPLGGLLLISAWGLLGLSAIQSKDK